MHLLVNGCLFNGLSEGIWTMVAISHFTLLIVE